MKEEGYKLGIRTERLKKGIHFGLGYVWFTEKVLVISFLFWEVYVGKVYDLDA